MNIQEIKDHNKQAGYHFFDADTMRFFRSRVSAEVHKGRYFVTSEQHASRYGDSPRRYTIREYNSATGSVETATGCEFQEFETLAQAKRAMRKL